MPVQEVMKIYDTLKVISRVYSFFDRMDLAYGAADIAVGRSGATFLAEIATKQIPAILIPYPFGDGHQIANAETFCRQRPAIVVEQKDLTVERLSGLFIRFLAGELSWKNKPDVSAKANARVLLADFIEESLRDNVS
jgi:UDP-N-acetylglucosamine:LPS N-acetylglucosamine transferase